VDEVRRCEWEHEELEPEKSILQAGEEGVGISALGTGGVVTPQKGKVWGSLTFL